MITVKFKSYLSEYFYMKDWEVLKYFLDGEVAKNYEGIFLYRRKYALDIFLEASSLDPNLQAF